MTRARSLHVTAELLQAEARAFAAAERLSESLRRAAAE